MATSSTEASAGNCPAILGTQDTELPEASLKKKHVVEWVTKAFCPSDTECSYRPTAGSLPKDPLANFSRYFLQWVFQACAMFTNVYMLQKDGIEIRMSEQEIKVFFGPHADGGFKISEDSYVLASIN